jgi:UDP-glucose 4-epimerase
MSLRDTLVGLGYAIAYRVAILFFSLSRLPVVGRLFEAPVAARRFTVVTVPVNAKLRETSAILPFDMIRQLVDSAAYVAIAEHCICREAHNCKDYPSSPGCVYLGEGARSIKYRTRQATKQEAVEWLDRARSLGLVTNVVWSSVEFEALGANPSRTVEICSCCPCCCLMFKTRDASKAYSDNILGFGTAHVMSPDSCTRCTNCEAACPFKAVRVDMHGGPAVDATRCKGCGRCADACRAGVLKVLPNENHGAVTDAYGHSTPNARELVERFLDMVK